MLVDNETAISHYGVKGQRWGVRKRRNEADRKAKFAPKPSVDARRAQELKAKPLTSLTNKQLKTLNERMNLEQNYKRLNPTEKSKAEQRVKEMLGTAALGTALYNTVNSPAGKALIGLGTLAVAKTLKSITGNQ